MRQRKHTSLTQVPIAASQCISEHQKSIGGFTMAKLKATPKNFEQALRFILDFKSKLSIRIGNNTYLEYHTGYGTGNTESITVRLHTTNIVTFWPSGRTTLCTGGHRTV